MQTLKYATLIDYVLVLLNNLRIKKPNTYVSLIQLLKVMDQNVSFSEIQELGKYLEAKAWAKIITPIGDVRAQITTNGIIYLEAKDEKFFSAYEEFKKSVTEGKEEKDLLVKLFDADDNPKNNIFQLLDKLKAKIIDQESENDF